jgi:alpha-glucosidase
VLSNHDFGRLPSRVGRAHERAAATLLLTLPGAAFVYQGDEIGVANGPGHDPPYDRMGRDSFRHPMQWDASALGGFTTGSPWLPLVDPAERNVAAQSRHSGSTLSYWRRLIELRRKLDGPLEWADVGERALAYRRGVHIVAISFADEPLALPPGEVVLASEHPDGGSLPPHAAVVVREA